jgi:phenylacetate-coenzyme A ligase PaaK-like adenylate-forming protein
MNQLIDIARGAYSRLPPRTRAKLASFLRFVPEDIKWGPSYRAWRAQLTAARDNPALIKEQRTRARLAMVEAAQRSPYYRALFAELFGAGYAAEHLLDDANWARIPILTGAAVVAHARDMCTRPAEDLDTGSTGGSSGQPVKFYLDPNRSPIEYAFVHDAWSRAGFRAGDARCVFRGLELSSTDASHMEYDPALAELRCSVFHLTDTTMRGYHDAIVGRGIRFIHGYPSAIAIFSAYLVRTGLAPLSQIAGVFLTSERFDTAQQDVVRQAFERATLVPFYGLSEKVAFATALTDDPDVFEFEPLYGYTELLDEHAAPVVTAGASGRIVSTGLLFPGMPFIRYDTGDTAELVALPEAANGYRLRVRGIRPKHATEYLVGRSGSLIAIKGVISNLQGTAYGIQEYQFYQDTPGEAVVRLVPLSPGATNFSSYRDLLNRKLAGELRVAVEIVDRIPMTPRGKRKFIDQRLDLSGRQTELRTGREAFADPAISRAS